ncbi:MAG: M23 family metallopeptidase [Parvibaculum sp.]|uniref:M23 family metallopeptidase n=1 Tax=Parvibaculum sp. TaxID=2024848 RepID=UPI0025D0D7D7|nr:M23 family metallopeptidase [Parvibaculum sp.]MCE9651330.1 M23 family metallopeptidase [Parvibaculum sp.]
MFDTGTLNEDDAPVQAPKSAETPVSAPRRAAQFRLDLQRTLKLYGSASRLALGQSLGQHRWLTAAGLAGVLSFGLLGAGIVTLVAPYSGVQTAALTADDAPQIIALHTNGNAETETIASAIVPVQQMAAADAAPVKAEPAQAEVAALEPAPEAAPEPELRSSTAETETTSALPENADIATASIAPAVPEMPKEVRTRIALDDGATLMQVLTDNGADRVDAYHAIAALRPIYSPSKLRSGQEISLTFLTTSAASDDETTPSKLLTAISLQPDFDREIEVQRGDDGSYTTEQIQKELTSGFARSKGTINSSLFLDAAQAGIPAPIIVEMIRMFSYSIDFQREIHPGDSFEVFFDRKYDEQGVAVKEGDIAYAALTVLGKQHRLWRYKMADGSWDYFDENGNSMKKFLMKTPIDGARISSSFGSRKHPILGYTKFHSGVDFAAPRGTPIYAAGDGVVKIAGWVNGYGKFIELGHANKYETAYGHMSAFAKGIRPGVRVHQGQVIGYVGTTGRSTGPHLHYEIHIAGKKVNPLGVKVATGMKLEGKQLAGFKATRAKVASQMAEAPMLNKVAQAGGTETASKAN